MYPNYTYAVLKQIEHWAIGNDSEILAKVYKPNTFEFPFLNSYEKVSSDDRFSLLLQNLSNSDIEIPEDFAYCPSFINCQPEHVEIVPGFGIHAGEPIP